MKIGVHWLTKDKNILLFLIIDDHPIIQAGISALLTSNFDGAGCSHAYSFEEAVVQLQQSSPNIILLDLSLPGVQGLQAIKLLRKVRHDTPILVFTGSEESEILERCMEAGASAYLHKDVGAQDICHTVRNLMDDAQYYVRRHLDVSGARRQQLARVSQFTKRQREVLILVYQGLMNKQIAFELGCSENTVKVHIRDIFKVLGVNSRPQAVALALKLGVFD